MTDPQRLDDIKAREEKATAGPWTVERHDQDDGTISQEIWNLTKENYACIVVINDGDHPRPPQNAAFIAHAREDIPWLLSQLSLAQSALRTARADAMEECQQVIDQFCMVRKGKETNLVATEIRATIRQLAQTGGEG